ncbi:caspase family protein [Erythrobacter sp. HKB08]|uniref:caspase family protein n=1 Tax=Erythrobacter sp. HKB08 TaxID=2502843 RepID=UPI001008FF41|nr:caspase family protein [Erythrobacter sp. HKB08]
MGRKLAFVLGAIALAVAPHPSVAHESRPRVIYATQSGDASIDSIASGGNPFATALIEALDAARPDAVQSIVDMTIEESGGVQIPDFGALPIDTNLRPADGENAVALVIVFSDYGDDAGLPTLPGASFDAARVAAAFTRAGFETQQVIAADRAEFEAALSTFRAAAEVADRSVIYTTGHGTEVDGEIYLIPPEADGADMALERFMPLGVVSDALASVSDGLLIYAGCRDNPFGL